MTFSISETVIFGVITFILGFITAYLWVKLKTQKSFNKALNEWHQKEKNFLSQLNDRGKQVDKLQLKLQNWEDKWHSAQDDFKQKEVVMRQEFELLAQKILEEKSQKFTALNQDNMKQILTPFKEAMSAFKEKVEQNEKESFGRHQALQEQLKNLQELNHKLSQEALNLTKALKGESKTQGIWGETILNRLLEKSGLEKKSRIFCATKF